MPKFKKSKEVVNPPEPIQKYERSYRHSRGEIIANNMLGGIFWGIGSIIGITLFLSLISLISQYVDLIPFIGNFISEVLNYLREKGSIRN